MLMTGSGSYYEQYKRHKGVKPGGLQDQRLLTDRAAYISFLEVQLERVSAACLSTQGFGDRIDQIQGQLYGTEEKILNLTHHALFIDKLKPTRRQTMNMHISQFQQISSAFNSIF